MRYRPDVVFLQDKACFYAGWPPYLKPSTTRQEVYFFYKSQHSIFFLSAFAAHVHLQQAEQLATLYVKPCFRHRKPSGLAMWEPLIIPVIIGPVLLSIRNTYSKRLRPREEPSGA